MKENKQETKSFKIDPAHMQDIFYYAKEDFLRSYSYFTREEYDEMITDFFRTNYTKEEILKEYSLDKWCKAVRRAYERKKKKVLKISTITTDGLKVILDHVKSLTEYNVMDGTGYYVIAQYNDEKHTIQGDLAVDISKTKDDDGKEYFTLYVDDNGLTEASWWEHTQTDSLTELKKLIQNIIKGFIENLQKQLHYEYEVFKIYPDLNIINNKKDSDFDIYGYTKDNQSIYICNANDKESADYVSNLLNDLAKAKMLVMNGKPIIRVLEK